MGYFANGPEGEMLDNQCEQCLEQMHDGKEQACCPVHYIHVLFNYDQLDNELLQQSMSMLVDGYHCKMKELIGRYLDHRMEKAIVK